MMDASTFAPEDAITVDVHVAPSREAVAGHIHKVNFVEYNPRHR